MNNSQRLESSVDQFQHPNQLVQDSEPSSEEDDEPTSLNSPSDSSPEEEEEEEEEEESNPRPSTASPTSEEEEESLPEQPQQQQQEQMMIPHRNKSTILLDKFERYVAKAATKDGVQEYFLMAAVGNDIAGRLQYSSQLADPRLRTSFDRAVIDSQSFLGIASSTRDQPVPAA